MIRKSAAVVWLRFNKICEESVVGKKFKLQLVVEIFGRKYESQICYVESADEDGDFYEAAQGTRDAIADALSGNKSISIDNEDGDIVIFPPGLLQNATIKLREID